MPFKRSSHFTPPPNSPSDWVPFRKRSSIFLYNTNIMHSSKHIYNVWVRISFTTEQKKMHSVVFRQDPFEEPYYYIWLCQLDSLHDRYRMLSSIEYNIHDDTINRISSRITLWAKTQEDDVYYDLLEFLRKNQIIG